MKRSFIADSDGDNEPKPVPKRRARPQKKAAPNNIAAQTFLRSLQIKKKKALKCFSDPQATKVDILVGETGQVFNIFLELISSRSEYFKKIFDKQFKPEGETKVHIMKDVEVRVFGLFSQWLYTESLEQDGTEVDILDLARLWKYAGVWQVPSLQNDAMRLLVTLPDAQGDVLGVDGNNQLKTFIDYVYSTEDCGKLKRLALYKTMSCIPNSGVDAWIRALPVALQTDLACEVIKQRTETFRVPDLRHRETYIPSKTEIDLTK